MKPILLASSSPYRRELLAKLGLKFSQESPDIDESPLPHETASQLVERLTTTKAQALATKHPNTFIIGSDQAATLEQQIIGKPLSYERAF